MNSSKIIFYDEQYRILLLDPGSSRQQIITAWKQEIQFHHPDRFSDSKHRRQAEERTKLLNVAKDKLVKYWDDFGKPPPDRLTLANIDYQEKVQSLKEAHARTIDPIKRDYEKQLDSLKRELAAAKSKITVTPMADTPHVTNFNISLTHNIANSGSIGMNLHAKFDIINARGMNTCLKARFYDRKMTLIRAQPISQYIDYGGYLAVFQNIIPEYQHSRFSTVMFIPYSEFSVPIGCQIEFISKIFVMQGVSTQGSLSRIAESPPVPFSISR